MSTPKVVLLASTPNPERLVACAARLCYSKSDACTLMDNMTDEQVTTLVRKIATLGHLSTFEHVSFTFGIDGVSRTLTHQLVRHRIASYSQQSQRYVDSAGKDAIIPHTISANPQALAIFVETLDAIDESYRKLRALDIPAEDARYCLSNATETKIMVTMNARELLHFFGKRCCSRAQWEIRSMAWQMLYLAREAAPLLFEKAGPHCITDDKCPEGAMSCGGRF